MLEVNNLNVFYGEFQVLEDVSLKADKGEFVAILGPNGHGKSTLLKTICGLHSSNSGSIILNGKNISNFPSTRIVEMGLVYVAEERFLFPNMTVLENLELGAYNRNARKNVLENLDFVFQLFPRLKERKKQLARSLSGGEAQMLALGRGLMSSAKFLAIDEPSLGLAPILVSNMFNMINEINKKGITIILVEQNISHIIEIAHRFYVIENRRIIFEGTKKNVLENKYIEEILLGI